MVLTKSKIFFYFCLFFILGIFLSSVIAVPRLLISGILILAVILISFLWSQKKLVIVGFCLIFLVLGIWRHQVAEFRVKNNELRNYNDLGLEISLIGRLIKEPDVRTNSQKLTVKPEKIYFNTLKYRSIKEGRVLVTASEYPEYKYGDKLEIKGKLETPAVFEDFSAKGGSASGWNYKNYLAKEGIYSVIYWSEIELLDREKSRGLTSTLFAKILDFKNKLRETIYQNLSPPQSSILGAMILGDKSRMSNDLKEKLNIAGVRHITAVSGLHITILSTILMSLLIGLGFYRGQAFYFSIILISLFIIMIGLHPSALRAGIMGGLYLLGQKIGRRSVSSRAILMAAAFMLALNPLLLLNDVGFQLSFLAVTGIIYLGPTFRKWLDFIPEEKLLNLKDVLTMTFSAYLFTLPIIIYNFGRLSLIAPVSNVLILPVIPLIMILGFIFVLLGIIFGFLGWIFSLPVWLLLTYLFKIIDFFSQGWAARTIENVHWLWLIISYLILGYWAWWLNRKERLKFLN